MKSRAMVVFLATSALVAVGCGSDQAEVVEPTAAAPAHEGEAFNFGSPADAAQATRVIEIEAHDDFTFSPSRVVVAVGETVTFRVTNTGQLPHDFTLGDSELQDEHDAEMAAMGEDMMAIDDEPNAFLLTAGETKLLSWHFDSPGMVIFGCHIPGHYAAGMYGDINVGDDE